MLRVKSMFWIFYCFQRLDLRKLWSNEFCKGIIISCLVNKLRSTTAETLWNLKSYASREISKKQSFSVTCKTQNFLQFSKIWFTIDYKSITLLFLERRKIQYFQNILQFSKNQFNQSFEKTFRLLLLIIERIAWIDLSEQDLFASEKGIIFTIFANWNLETITEIIEVKSDPGLKRKVAYYSGKVLKYCKRIWILKGTKLKN